MEKKQLLADLKNLFYVLNNSTLKELGEGKFLSLSFSFKRLVEYMESLEKEIAEEGKDGN